MQIKRITKTSKSTIAISFYNDFIFSIFVIFVEAIGYYGDCFMSCLHKNLIKIFSAMLLRNIMEKGKTCREFNIQYVIKLRLMVKATATEGFMSTINTLKNIQISLT